MIVKTIDHGQNHKIFKMDLKICRICGGGGGAKQLRTILDEDSDMINKLFICANINMHPGDILPKLICGQCEKNLNLSYRLRKQSEATEKRLRQEIQRKQKSSVPAKEVNTSDTESIDLSQFSDGSNEMETIDENVSEAHKIDEKKKNETTTPVLQESGLNKIEVNMYNFINYEHKLELQSATSDKEKEKHEDQNVIITIPVENDYTFSNFLINVNEDDCGNRLKEIASVPTGFEYSSIDLISSSASSMSECGDNFKGKQVEPLTPDRNTFSCDICHEVYATKKECSIHMKQHGVEQYQCIQCFKFFPSRFRLKRHEEIHNEWASHQCSYCNRNYRALYNLQRHVRSAHLGKKCWECSICNIGFSRIDVLKRHLKLHSEEKKFRCLMCSKSFKTKDYLGAHLKVHHTSKAELSKNNKRAKKESTNKRQCGYCGKLFRSSFSYNNHLLIHTNEKPYKCDSCNKNFRTIAALTIHQRIHDDYRPYQCDLCLKSFRQTAHLKEHKILHLNEAPKHVCSICQAPFARKSNLKAHIIRMHTKEKPFKCADCSAEFSYMHLLQRHANKVHYRSINKDYTINDVDEIIGSDDGMQINDSLETDIYHYIDTVADDDEFDDNTTHFVNLIENIQDILETPSPELEAITKPPVQQHTCDNNYVAPDSETIVDYIEMSSDDEILDHSYDDENYIKEQKVDLLVTEETKLTRTEYNVHKK